MVGPFIRNGETVTWGWWTRPSGVSHNHWCISPAHCAPLARQALATCHYLLSQTSWEGSSCIPVWSNVLQRSGCCFHFQVQRRYMLRDGRFSFPRSCTKRLGSTTQEYVEQCTWTGNRREPEHKPSLILPPLNSSEAQGFQMAFLIFMWSSNGLGPLVKPQPPPCVWFLSFTISLALCPHFYCSEKSGTM